MTHQNDGKHIANIMDRKACHIHGVPKGVPCYHLKRNGAPGYFPGICNQRVVLAGFNGKISESSFQARRKQNDRVQRKQVKKAS